MEGIGTCFGLMLHLSRCLVAGWRRVPFKIQMFVVSLQLLAGGDQPPMALAPSMVRGSAIAAIGPVGAILMAYRERLSRRCLNSLTT
jgi:hypothetical protein